MKNLLSGLLFLLLLIPAFSQQRSAGNSLSTQEVQVPMGWEAQAAPEEVFPGGFERSPLSMEMETMGEDTLLMASEAYRPSLTGKDLLFMGLGGLGMGAAAFIVGALAGAAWGASIDPSGWGALILAIFLAAVFSTIGIPLGVWLVGNNYERRGNFWATLGLSLVGSLAFGISMVIPPLGLVTWVLPIVGAILGWWLTSRYLEPQYYEFEDGSYYEEYQFFGRPLHGMEDFPIKAIRNFFKK